MKTTNGNYLLSMQIELTPEEIAAILENQKDIIDEDIGSHEVIEHLRSFVDENIHHITKRLIRSYDGTELSYESTLSTIRPLLKERKKK
jgi:hypothetical protein